jgi:hypothetical protein
VGASLDFGFTHPGFGYRSPAIEGCAGLNAGRLPVNDYVFFTRAFRESLTRRGISAAPARPSIPKS